MAKAIPPTLSLTPPVAPARARSRQIPPAAPARVLPSRAGRRLRQTVAGIALGGILAYLLAGPAFRVATVDLQGAEGPRLAQVRERVGSVGSNIFLVSTDELRRQIKGLPWVQDAHVRRALPNRIVIAVTPREPRLRWLNARGIFAVDGQGVVMGRPAEGSGLPLVYATDDRDLAAAGSIDPSLVAGALRVSQFFAGGVNAAARVEYRAGEGFRLSGPAGWTAVLGEGPELEQRLTILRSLLEGRPNWTFTDLRATSRPYVRGAVSSAPSAGPTPVSSLSPP